ncbi:MAG: hypothetical protein QXN71_03140 [Candidatus Aenigmatarchaeota archaeon]
MAQKSLSEISGVPEPESRDFVLQRSRELARRYIHKCQRRLTGEPFIRHPERLEKLVCSVLKETELKIPARASALVHECSEDSNIQVFGEEPCLSNFYKNVENDGKSICYIVDKLTHKKDIRYIVYMYRLFRLAPSGKERDLDLLTLIIKMLDRYENTNPKDRINKDYYVDEFREFKKQGRERELLKKYNIRNSNRRLSEREFLDLLGEKLVRKLLVNAIDNTGPYLPKIEYSYPYLWAAEKVFSEELTEEDRRLFYPDVVNEIMDECKHNSEAIIRKYRDRFRMEWISDLGYFRK